MSEIEIKKRNEKILIKNYTIIDRIGIGSYGRVYKVEKNKKIYVLKEIPINNQNTTTEKIISVKNEAKILSSLNSKYIVKYYDSFIQGENLYIVMEYCEGGDLFTFMSECKKIRKNKNYYLIEKFIWKIFIQISLGLYYIHKKNILHRDVKTLNIFLTKDYNSKIGDLGVAKILEGTSHANTFVGTPYYISPEMCKNIPYNSKSDIWSLGCILYEMITFKHPFTAANQAALFIKIINGEYIPLPNNVPIQLKMMIEFILQKDYIKRPSMEDIITNDIFIHNAQKYGFFEEIKEIKEIIKNVKIEKSKKCKNEKSGKNKIINIFKKDIPFSKVNNSLKKKNNCQYDFQKRILTEGNINNQYRSYSDKKNKECQPNKMLIYVNYSPNPKNEISIFKTFDEFNNKSKEIKTNLSKNNNIIWENNFNKINDDEQNIFHHKKYIASFSGSKNKNNKSNDMSKNEKKVLFDPNLFNEVLNDTIKNNTIKFNINDLLNYNIFATDSKYTTSASMTFDKNDIQSPSILCEVNENNNLEIMEKIDNKQNIYDSENQELIQRNDKKIRLIQEYCQDIDIKKVMKNIENVIYSDGKEISCNKIINEITNYIKEKVHDVKKAEQIIDIFCNIISNELKHKLYKDVFKTK